MHLVISVGSAVQRLVFSLPSWRAFFISRMRCLPGDRAQGHICPSSLRPSPAVSFEDWEDLWCRRPLAWTGTVRKIPRRCVRSPSRRGCLSFFIFLIDVVASPFSWSLPRVACCKRNDFGVCVDAAETSLTWSRFLWDKSGVHVGSPESGRSRIWAWYVDLCERDNSFQLVLPTGDVRESFTPVLSEMRVFCRFLFGGHQVRWLAICGRPSGQMTCDLCFQVWRSGYLKLYLDSERRERLRRYTVPFSSVLSLLSNLVQLQFLFLPS